MADYTEGQHLKGSDGKMYVVMGGVPRQVIATDPKVGLDLTGKTLGNRREGIAVQKDTATLPSDIARSKSEADIAASNAALLRQKVEDAAIAKRLEAMGPTTQIHGDAYLKQFVPPSQWETVKAYARGDLGSKAGGMSASMLPIIQHAMNYDPTASGANFPARAKMQSDLAGSQPNTAGGSLRAMERMLLHGREVLRGGQALNNYGPGVVGSTANAVRTAYEHYADDPTLAHYEALVRNYAPEAQKAIAQTSGGVDERADRTHGFNGSMSQASRAGALQADARQALDAMGAVNEQYKRLLGHDIVDALSPDAKKAYDEIMAGGFGPDGKPLHPADGWKPISGASPPGASGGNSTPNDPVAPASGPLKTDPEKTAYLDKMIRAGTPWPTASRLLQKAGLDTEGTQSSYEAAVKYVHDPKHPERVDVPTSYADVVAPTTLLNRALATPVGTFAADALNTAMGGVPEMVGGEGTRLGLQANDAANPKSAFLGKTAGFVGGAYGLGKVGKAVGVLKDAAKAAPIIDGAIEAVPGRLSQMGSYLRAASPDAVLGASNGAAEHPDHPFLGAGLGLAGVAGGNVLGHTVLAPALRYAAETAPGQALASAVIRAGQGFADARGGGAGIAPSTRAAILQAATGAGDGFAPVPKLSAADQILARSGALGPDGLPVVRDNLQQAADLGMPMTLADADPRLRMLGGSAARYSPDTRALAETVLGARSAARTGRTVDQINQHLAPPVNMADFAAQNRLAAQAASKAHYDAAMGQPPVPATDLNGLLDTPGGAAAAKQGYTNALNSGTSPGQLSMSIDPTTGQPMFNAQIDWHTLQNIKQGMDGNLSGLRNPLTGKLDMTPGSPAQGLDALRRQYVTRLGELNPDYAAGNAAYAAERGKGSAAQQGFDLASRAGRMNPDEVANIAASVPPDNAPFFRQGYASHLADKITNTERDPYAILNGSDGAQQRLAALFPEGAPKIAAANRIEDQFGLTNKELMGGSPTQARSVADRMFQAAPFAGMGLDALTAAHTGMPVGTFAALGTLGLIRKAAEASNNKMTTAVADELGPQLLNTDPTQNLATINLLLKQDAARKAYLRQWGQAGGAVGGTLGAVGAFGAGQ